MMPLLVEFFHHDQFQFPINDLHSTPIAYTVADCVSFYTIIATTSFSLRFLTVNQTRSVALLAPHAAPALATSSRVFGFSL
jgi:hypothetical protein